MTSKLKKQRARIAPTPSGYLHLGNAYSFVITTLDALRNDAEVFLRIDDLDRERFRETYLDDIFEVLNFLGIEPTIGPSGPEDFHRNFSQHLRLDRYNALLEELRSTDLIYPCVCSRKEFATIAPLAFCGCRSSQFTDQQQHVVWRWAGELPDQIVCDSDGKTQSVTLKNAIGRLVLQQKNTLPAYQIASLSDDLDFEITRVVRGEDLIHSTAFQLYLASVLGKSEFGCIRFFHHGLVTDSAEKISKSDGATSLHSARQQGLSVAQFYTKIAHSWGFKTKKVAQLSELNDLLGDAFPACSRVTLSAHDLA